MKPEGENKYGSGTILDPRDGKIYKATMKVTPDGQTLIVRGYIGFELLGQNQYWTRLRFRLQRARSRRQSQSCRQSQSRRQPEAPGAGAQIGNAAAQAGGTVRR